MISWLIYLFSSGLAFFIGVGCIVFAVLVFCVNRQRWLKTIATLTVVVGLLLIGLSSTPLSYWLYSAAVGLTVLLLFAECSERRFWKGRRLALRVLVVALWMTCAELERRCQVITPLRQGKHRRLAIIGDSLAAGVGERAEATWPHLLATTHSIQVQNQAKVGATAESAFSQVKGLVQESSLILIEIGGNDVLGTTPNAKFANELDRLLEMLCRFSSDVIMFELPLPPLHNEFGRMQRELAEKHSVRLIPKRMLASVLAESGATIDSLHLSPQGHERLAEAVWSVIGPAFAGNP